MKYCVCWLMLGLFACQEKSSSSGGPDPVPEASCEQVLQNLKLNDSLQLTDLDGTTRFIQNNALELQRLEVEEAAAVWACLEKG